LKSPNASHTGSGEVRGHKNSAGARHTPIRAYQLLLAELHHKGTEGEENSVGLGPDVHHLGLGPRGKKEGPWARGEAIPPGSLQCVDLQLPAHVFPDEVSKFVSQPAQFVLEVASLRPELVDQLFGRLLLPGRPGAGGRPENLEKICFYWFSLSILINIKFILYEWNF
jgi:hypothetical protein